MKRSIFRNNVKNVRNYATHIPKKLKGKARIQIQKRIEQIEKVAAIYNARGKAKVTKSKLKRMNKIISVLD